MPKIMVLEDEPVLLQLLDDLLTFEGYEVLRPKGFASVIEEMRADPPNAVLIDVNLKDANGLDVLDQIRADEELRDTFVILASGLDHRKESIQRGADAYLMKPYMPDELMTVLNKRGQE